MKFKEIGSEFWIEDLPGRNIKGIPEWMNFGSYKHLTTTGRGALSQILAIINNQIKYKIALLPDYICDSVIIPFLNAGYNCMFYNINKNLTVNISQLSEITEKNIGVFLHLGYYGFPTNNNLSKIIVKLKRKKTFIIEDVTHTFFSIYDRYLENDFYFASVRKWFSIPSGGYLGSVKPFYKIRLPDNNSYVVIREKAMKVKWNYISFGNEEYKSTYLDLFKKAEIMMNRDNQVYSIDSNSETILNSIDYHSSLNTRRYNFQELLSGFKSNNLIKPVFYDLPDYVFPLFFPIYINSKYRNALRNYLIEKKIFCPIHWPIPQIIQSYHYPKSNKIYNSILSIPCDQRYTKDDMHRIIKTINSYLKKLNKI